MTGYYVVIIVAQLPWRPYPPRSAGRILCSPPLVTLSTSFTLSFSQFVPLALATERNVTIDTSEDVLAVVVDI